MNNLEKDFKLFAKDQGVSPITIDKVSSHIHSSLTSVVLEERKMDAVAVDVFSRLLYDRIIYFGHEFNTETCNLAIAQLLYLSSIDNQDIQIYINSPGGSVIDGLGLIDTINFIENKVSTTCIGMAASMGAVLLSCGEKGQRFVLPHSRVMIHQVSSAMKGTYSDMKIEFEQTERCKNDIYAILSQNMNKPIEEIEQLCDRNNWYIGEEAVAIGLADQVVEKH